MHKLLLILFSLFSLNLSFALDCMNPADIEKLAVQERGRVKPYLVMAQEEVKFITGKKSIGDYSSTQVFCYWTLESLGMKAPFETLILVEHFEVKKMVGLEENEIGITYDKLVNYKDDIRQEISQLKQSTAYKKELEKVFTRLRTYETITQGRSWTTPVMIEGEVVWHGFSDVFSEYNNEIVPTLLSNEEAYNKQITTSTHKVEYLYQRSHIFNFSLLVSLIALFFVVLNKEMTVGRYIAILSIVLQTIGLIMRVYISGRAPITNMYETVMFSGYSALIIAIIITYFKKEKLFLIAGLAYTILCLFMMMFANSMLDSSISPLVPILRDNFWLSTHVTTIILSYGALALTWMIANIILFKVRFSEITRKEYRYYEDLAYTCMKVGVVLLAAGIILGGVWADYSWGRFWGWDPKETWSLIVLLFYMAILHGKSTKWVNSHRFIVLSAAGFMLVMMAWFGVNYILATGLHSYGFSEGGALFLGTFFLSQIIFIAFTGIKPKTKNIKEAAA